MTLDTQQQQQTDDWQKSESLTKFRGDDGTLKTEDLAKSYVHLEKSIGGRVPIPAADAKPEEWDAFYGKIGRPEKAEGYDKYQAPEGLPWDADVEGRFFTVAHKHGLTKNQAKALLEWYGSEGQEGITRAEQAIQANRQGAWDTLRKSWGANAEARVALAQQAVEKVGGEELKAVLDETGLGDHPAFLKFAERLGALLQEDGEISPVVGAVQQKQAQDEINRLMADKAYTDSEHPDHVKVIQRIRELSPVAWS